MHSCAQHLHNVWPKIDVSTVIDLCDLSDMYHSKKQLKGFSWSCYQKTSIWSDLYYLHQRLLFLLRRDVKFTLKASSFCWVILITPYKNHMKIQRQMQQLMEQNLSYVLVVESCLIKTYQESFCCSKTQLGQSLNHPACSGDCLSDQTSYKSSINEPPLLHWGEVSNPSAANKFVTISFIFSISLLGRWTMPEWSQSGSESSFHFVI